MVAMVYADRLAAWFQGWDIYFFWLVVAMGLLASCVGTQIVLRIAAQGGEPPANDELFNLNFDHLQRQAQEQPVSSAARRRWWPEQLSWRRAHVRPNSAAAA